MICLEIPFTLKIMSPSLATVTICLCMVTTSSSSRIIIRMVPMAAVSQVVLSLVDISEAPCINSIVGRKGHGVHPQVILIMLPCNELVRFSSTVPYESNGATTTPLAMIIVYIARGPTTPSKLVIIIKFFCILPEKRTLLMETGGIHWLLPVSINGRPND